MIRQELMIALKVVLLITFAPLISSPSLAAKPHLSGTPDIIKDSDLSITVNYQAKELGKKNSQCDAVFTHNSTHWMRKSWRTIVSVERSSIGGDTKSVSSDQAQRRKN